MLHFNRCLVCRDWFWRVMWRILFSKPHKTQDDKDLEAVDDTIPRWSASLYFSSDFQLSLPCQQVVTWKHKRKAESLSHCILKTDHMYDERQGIERPHNEKRGAVPPCPYEPGKEDSREWLIDSCLLLRKSWLIPVKAIGLLNHINSNPRHLVW